MARGQAVARVDGPASTVWRTVADHRGIATWGPGMSVTMERDGEPTPDGLGAVRAINGPGFTFREEITGFEPARQLAYRALSGIPLPGYAGDVTLAERDGRTTIRWRLTSTSSLPGVGLVLDLIAGTLLSRLVRAIRRAG
jgi:hypothetical protein